MYNFGEIEKYVRVIVFMRCPWENCHHLKMYFFSQSYLCAIFFFFFSSLLSISSVSFVLRGWKIASVSGFELTRTPCASLSSFHSALNHPLWSFFTHSPLTLYHSLLYFYFLLYFFLSRIALSPTDPVSINRRWRGGWSRKNRNPCFNKVAFTSFGGDC